ncbi:MAG TPA: phytanoyl-CoA dioxygenase family protein [Flavitalea sp.]|nr:phytanoyl-CoA dioxygenase family protein [Flavitalea sp.]
MNVRKFKPAIWLYNLFHYRRLLHNKRAYAQYHLHKPLIASLSSKDFPDTSSQAWLDIHDAEIVAQQKKGFYEFPQMLQNEISGWSRNGFLVLPGFLDTATCNSITREIDHLLSTKKIQYAQENKIMFANRCSRLIDQVTQNPLLKKVLSFILDKDVVPFQTINFIKGSEQRAHSDSIHMTTYPLGYLIAAWIALEDVDADNGPLFYYPGSHKLPYMMNESFNEGENFLRVGKKDYRDYEDMIELQIGELGLKKVELHVKKGDVFVWHANLLHGGSPILDTNRTRKSMVIHYFAKDVIKYHEITERPSLLEERH